MKEDTGMIGCTLYCYECKCVSLVIKVNVANMSHADPTETYTLKCGHTVI